MRTQTGQIEDGNASHGPAKILLLASKFVSRVNIEHCLAFSFKLKPTVSNMSGRSSKLRYLLDKHKGRNIPLEKQRKHEKDVARQKRGKQQKKDGQRALGRALQNGEAFAKVKGVEKSEIADILNGDSEDSSGWEDEEQLEHGEEEELSEDDFEEFDDEGVPVIEAKASDRANGVAKAEAAIAAGADEDEEEDDEDISNDEREEEDPEDEEDVPLSDLSSVSDSQDITPHQKLTKNNIPALQKALKSIQLPYTKLPFSTYQSITSTQPVSISDPNNDLEREAAFYQQSLDAVRRGRAQLLAEGAPFTRPQDYFAEMVKTDEHVGKVKGRLVDSAAARKASEDAKRQRQAKKYGKQVQQERLKERSQAKREMLDKVSALKRKRRDTGGIGGEGQREEDLFDVAVDDAPDGERKVKRRKGDEKVPGKKRVAKDQKFGFGGKKRHSKSNDAKSSGDTRDYSLRKMKGGAGKGKPQKRLGKSRRQKMT